MFLSFLQVFGFSFSTKEAESHRTFVRGPNLHTVYRDHIVHTELVTFNPRTQPAQPGRRGRKLLLFSYDRHQMIDDCHEIFGCLSKKTALRQSNLIRENIGIDTFE